MTQPATSLDGGPARTEIGGYRLERPLGRGGMAEVWLGRHQTSNGLAAIKILKPSAAAELADLFDNEQRAVLRLRHPNIVPIFDVGSDYIAAAYIEGVDLRHRMRSPMAPAEAIAIACAIGSALAAAHAQRVVHCDVKPANVLLDQTGTPFLADFGIARILDGSVIDDSPTAGTPAYMSPEQRDGRATSASDQYSLARTLLAMLAGRSLPIEPTHALLLLPEVLVDRLGPTLARAMSVAPAERFPTMDAFVDALRTAHVDDTRATSMLAPLTRSPARFAWATKPVKIERIGESIVRADYLLSTLEAAGLVAPTAARAFRQKTGYADFGWAVYARSERLGPLTEPEALARCSETVVLMHGLFTSREVWRDVAIGIARDNGLAAALTPDIGGFGASVFAPDAPSGTCSADALVSTLAEWLTLIGLDGTPTVVLGHSYSAATLMCARDAQLSPGVHRICVTPTFFFHRWTLRTWVRVNAVMAFVASLFPRAMWSVVVRFMFRRDASLAKISVTARGEMAAAAIRLGVRRLGHLFWSIARARPAPPDELARCTVVTTPDDPLVPESLAEASIAATGIPASQWYRLVYGSHFPQLVDEEHPEWGARNVHELVSVVDSVLDMTRTTGKARPVADSESSDAATLTAAPAPLPKSS